MAEPAPRPTAQHRVLASLERRRRASSPPRDSAPNPRDPGGDGCLRVQPRDIGKAGATTSSCFWPLTIRAVQFLFLI